jgi:putative peptidoglycan lipid II flippase
MSKAISSARAASRVSLAVLLSRILGLVREMFFARIFGAGMYMDAWWVAFRVPNLLRDLFAEGALSAAFVPTFTETLKRDGRKEAWYLANLVLSSLLILLGIFALVLFYFSDFFVYLLAAGYADVPGKLEVTSYILKILSPFLLLIACATVAMGILNTLNHFFLPALAPAFFNLALIASAIFLVPSFESYGYLPVYAMGFGAIIGGIFQFGVQVPAMWKEGYRIRFRINLNHPGLRKLALLIGPAVIGASAVQVNILINTLLASFLQDNGPVSWLGFAFRIIYLPIGLFGVAIGTVNLKEVSAYAAESRMTELRETVANSLKLVSFLAIPSTVGLMLLANPIVEMLYERGGFTAEDTYFTALAVSAYSVGLLAYSCGKVFVPTFYALGSPKIPVQVSFLTVLTNIIINLFLIWVLPPPVEFVGLALGTSAAALFSNSILSMMLRRRIGDLGEFRVWQVIAKVTVASLIMGAAVYFLHGSISEIFPPTDNFRKILKLGTVVFTGITVYAIGCWILRLEELKSFTSIFKKR